MKKSLMAMIMLLSPLIAHSEVVSGFKIDDGEIMPLRKDCIVWIGCNKCGALKDVLSERLAKSGIRVVSSPGESTTRMLLAFKISVPQGDVNKLLFAEEVYGKGLPPITPALNGNEKINIPYSIAPIDAAHIHQGRQLTGSIAGGIAIGVLGSLFSEWMGDRAADTARTPGFVQVAVKVADTVERKGGTFTVLSVANTQETPDTLLEGAVDAVAGLLINGAQGAKSNKEQSDAQ